MNEPNTPQRRGLIIAIDGPAGSGKSTTARLVARALGSTYLDTGAMYRAVALHALRAGDDMQTASAAHVRVRYEEGEMRVYLGGDDVTDAIRTPEVGEMASRVSALAPVREAMVAMQRRIAFEEAESGTGVVLDGRDIGTVVFPNADLKIFLVARPEVRAQRRLAELQMRGIDTTLAGVTEEMERRDRQDSGREHSPLRQAEDATVIDTSDFTIEEQVALIVAKARERL